MTAIAQQKPANQQAIHHLVGEHARELSEKLQQHRLQLFPPSAKKTLRRFTSGEAAALIGVDPGYLRRLTLEGGDHSLMFPIPDGGRIQLKTFRPCVVSRRERQTRSKIPAAPARQ